MTITASPDVEPELRGKRPSRRIGRVRGSWARRAPLLPALIFTVLVTQAPFAVTVLVSFLDWNVLRPGEGGFTGLDNYAFAFTDARLRTALLNTALLTTSVVVLSVALGLLTAVLLDRRFPGRGVARTLLIAPFLVMPVAAALLWKHTIYNPDYGLLNGTLNAIWRAFGAEQGPVIDWVSTRPMPAVVVVLVWQWTPFMMLIILAGLQSQPAAVIEAARVDGASNWQIFTNMTLPHLRRYIELCALLGSIYVLQTFDAIFTITQGGPGTATTNLPYEIYLLMFRKYEYGQAAAAGVVVVALTIVGSTLVLRMLSSLFRAEVSR